MRDAGVGDIGTDGIYGSESAAATSQFQTAHNLPATGKFDDATANLLLTLHSADGMLMHFNI
jgi:peptidoglycan hydrolase-like protein with peptidoglycan-binding domain